MAIANVVELRKVVSEQETASLHDVAKAIGIKLRLADQNENDAANHRKEAGEMLVTLRKRVEADNQSWKQFVYDYFDRPRSEIEQLMKHVAANKVVKTAIDAKPELARKSDRAIAKEIGVGKDTVRRAREATGAFATVEKRIGQDGKARKLPEPKQAKPKPQSAPKRITLLFDEPCEDCVTKQEQWHRSASVMASEAASLPAYWMQQFGKHWETFDVPSDVLTLAKQAAEAWNEIVESMITRNGADPVKLSLSAQGKLDAAIRQHKRKLDIEFEQRVRDECRKRIEETILPSYNKSKDEYDSFVKSRRGVMTKAEYNLIRACLHPDNSMTGEKRQKAWDLFSALELAFLDEKNRPTSDFTMPRTYEELMALKREVSEARKAKRKASSNVTLR
jgi:hypothetical protein